MHSGLETTITAGADRPAPPSLGPDEADLRRLRYYRDLLLEGYRGAVAPGAPLRSFRTDRLSLGIELPELDALPLWAVRRDDGAVSIPFIEYLLGQVRETLERLDRRAAGRAEREGLRALRRDLGSLRLDPSLEASPLPRLADLFLPGELVESLCAPGGRIDRVVARCEALIRPARV